MTRRATFRMSPGLTAGVSNVERLDLQAFARRLHQIMNERGISQSDLARKLWGERTDSRGHVVAKNRDRISVWVRGAGYPDPKNLQKLAEALGVDKKDLAPDIVASAIDRENPEIAITAVSGHPDSVHLQVNRLVSMATATKIMALLADPDA